MAEYIIIYHGGSAPKTKEEGEAGKARWMKWMQDLGENIVNFGTPFMGATIVSQNGKTREGALTGYSIVKADSAEEALEIAKACPHLEMGEVEVAELMQGMGG